MAAAAFLDMTPCRLADVYRSSGETQSPSKLKMQAELSSQRSAVIHYFKRPYIQNVMNLHSRRWENSESQMRRNTPLNTINL
jgi:predicted HD phosphohydrolase